MDVTVVFHDTFYCVRDRRISKKAEDKKEAKLTERTKELERKFPWVQDRLAREKKPRALPE